MRHGVASTAEEEHAYLDLAKMGQFETAIWCLNGGYGRTGHLQTLEQEGAVNGGF